MLDEVLNIDQWTVDDDAKLSENDTAITVMYFEDSYIKIYENDTARATHMATVLTYTLPEGTYQQVPIRFADAVLSYVEIGSYAIDDHNIKATTDTATFVFKIQDESTLILVENSSGFDIPIDSIFCFNEDYL